MFLALMGPQEGIEMAESIGLAKFSIGQLFVLFLLMLNTCIHVDTDMERSHSY